jgi:3-dehydroquinate synthetase
VPPERLLEHVQRDKKVFGDTPRWILPCGVGRAAVSAVGEAQLRQALAQCAAPGGAQR